MDAKHENADRKRGTNQSMYRRVPIKITPIVLRANLGNIRLKDKDQRLAS
jgi:hypothetical protein